KWMKSYIAQTALLAAVIGVSAPAIAADQDCKKLKAKVEQELKDKGDSGSYVRIYEADDKVEGKEIGFCYNGARKVVLFEVDPA
ncbi:hypothetical protein, partial [Oleiphilus sp. HI0079]|uniref:hypothetical protein n=2 Tax=Oleiphilus sp. HI0079 TaxID=1822254 RepID=UPI000A8F4525